MPTIKPQTAKAINTINLQPERMTSKIQLMVMMDISGSKGNDIASAVGLTPARVSVIRNSPMFIAERDRQMIRLREEVIDKKSTSVASGDPVELRIKGLADSAVDVYKEILENGKSEIVRKTTADAVLDRSGYKAYTEKTKISVEVTEKMASRFEEVLGYDESGSHARKTTVRVKKEMS